MKINLHKIKTKFNEKFCYVHARGVIQPCGDMLVTMQPLKLSGVDDFYGIEYFNVDLQTFTRTQIKKSKNLTRKPFLSGTIAVSDCTPFYHKKSGRVLILGHSVVYDEENRLKHLRPRHTVYSTFDYVSGDFNDFSILDNLSDDFYFCGNGSGQSLEDDDGTILIPVSFISKADLSLGKHVLSSAVMRCEYNNGVLRVLDVGKSLSLPLKRGLGEPSIIRHGDEYFMCLRADEDGFLAKSKDGLNYSTPINLTYDDGSSVGNYCTQQHFLSLGDNLFIVYTRRNKTIPNVFRHRAPLYIAQVDVKSLTVKKQTERIVVPNRGARCGNFGCCSSADGRGYVIVAEWMQFGGGNENEYLECAKYGSDNSIFIAEIIV